MAISIGSNRMSLLSQRSLSKATDQVATAQERLASGMRINSASDDAAGLAIADALNADSRVYAQAVRNINDGISVANLAEGAISELSNIVMRLQELSVQASNGSVSYTQRKALDEEAQALAEEYSRIQQSTEYNGMNILNGEVDNLRIQSGFGQADSISIATSDYSDMKAHGDGTFQDPVSSISEFGLWELEAGEFNGDGITDLIAMDYGGQIRVLIGNGDGTFEEDASYAAGTLSQRLSLGDFNGDGNLDVVTGNKGDGDISVLLGNANGTFEAAVKYTAGVGTEDVSVADLNDDGILDIAAGNTGDDNISIFMGNGNGTFQTQVSYSGVGYPTGISFADMNDDGKLDLVASAGDISIALGNGNGTFQTITSVSARHGNGNPVLEDFDEDGVLDVVVVDRDADLVSFMRGNGNGTFQAEVTYLVGDVPEVVKAADLNGDGHLDLAIANTQSDDLSVLIGNGDGTFQSAVTLTGAVDNPRGLTLADINGDDVLDLVAPGHNDSTGSVKVFLGNYGGENVAALEDFSLKNLYGARSAMDIFETKLEELTLNRSSLGAFQARLETAVNHRQVSVENYKAAESRIRDADIASEAANLVRNQILQKAATAVLAQANQQPALILDLLKQE